MMRYLTEEHIDLLLHFVDSQRRDLRADEKEARNAGDVGAARDFRKEIKQLTTLRGVLAQEKELFTPNGQAVAIRDEVAKRAWISAKNIYILGPTPVVQGDPPKPMGLASHGWGDWQQYYDPDTPETWAGDACYYEVVAEEAGGTLVKVAEELLGRENESRTWEALCAGAVIAVYKED